MWYIVFNTVMVDYIKDYKSVRYYLEEDCWRSEQAELLPAVNSSQEAEDSRVGYTAPVQFSSCRGLFARLVNSFGHVSECFG